MSYSIDLRERVLTFIEMGSSKTAASHIFGISRPTIDSWIRRKKTTGTLKDDRPKRGWKKINPQALKDYIAEYPELILADYAKHFGASIPSICLAFQRLKITRKKRQLFTESGTKKSAQYFWST